MLIVLRPLGLSRNIGGWARQEISQLGGLAHKGRFIYITTSILHRAAETFLAVYRTPLSFTLKSNCIGNNSDDNTNKNNPNKKEAYRKLHLVSPTLGHSISNFRSADDVDTNFRDSRNLKTSIQFAFELGVNIYALNFKGFA